GERLPKKEKKSLTISDPGVILNSTFFCPSRSRPLIWTKPAPGNHDVLVSGVRQFGCCAHFSATEPLNQSLQQLYSKPTTRMALDRVSTSFQRGRPLCSCIACGRTQQGAIALSGWNPQSGKVSGLIRAIRVIRGPLAAGLSCRGNGSQRSEA